MKDVKMFDRYEFLQRLLNETLLFWKKSNIRTTLVSDDVSLDAEDGMENSVELFLAAKIKEIYPNDRIFTENNEYCADAEYSWIIDPIDGTLNYCRGIPLYSTSIALSKNDKFWMGGVVDLSNSRIFRAMKGDGAYLNDSMIFVSKTCVLSESFILSSSFCSYGDRKNILARLFESAAQVRIFSSSALDLCLVAMGSVDARILANAKLCDLAAAKVILEEAGGEISSWDGSVFTGSHFKQIVASNGKLHKKLLELIR